MAEKKGDAKSKAEKEALIEWHLGHALEPLGFRRGEPVRYSVSADRVWWFFRRGQKFATEIVAVLLQWRAPGVILIKCFASPLEPAGLREQGLGATTATGNTPHHYFVHGLDRDQDDVLPLMIPLGKPEDWQALFERVHDELASLDRDFWDDYLWHAWQERLAHELT